MSPIISTYSPVLSGTGLGKRGLRRRTGRPAQAHVANSSNRSHCRCAASRQARRSASSVWSR